MTACLVSLSPRSFCVITTPAYKHFYALQDRQLINLFFGLVGTKVTVTTLINAEYEFILFPMERSHEISVASSVPVDLKLLLEMTAIALGCTDCTSCDQNTR